MTQPDSTTPAVEPVAERPDRPTRTTRIREGVQVKVRDDPQERVGLVVPSDDWWDTLRLRGVAPMHQVLIEWFPEGNTMRLWYRTSDLEAVRAP